MRALLIVLPSLFLAMPAMAQTATIVMHYTAPDGTAKTIPSTQPGVIVTMEECRASLPDRVPVLMAQLGNTRNFPEFAGWEFKGARCDIYGDHLLSTVE